MDELLTGWARVIASPKFLDALDAGEAAVIHLFGDIIDEWLQGIAPAYKLAVEACDMVDVGSFDCDAQRVKMRDTILTEILVLTGIIVLLRQALRLWRKIPADVKEKIRKQLVAASAISDLLANPDSAKLYSAVVVTYDLVKDKAMPIVNDVWKGDLNSPAVTAYLRDLSTLEPTSFFRVCRYYGFDIETMGYEKIRNLAKQTFGPIIGEYLNLMINPVAKTQLALTVGVEGAKYIGKGLIEVGGIVVELGDGAAKAIVAAGGEIVAATGDLLGDAIETGGDILESLGEGISGAAGDVADFFGF